MTHPIGISRYSLSMFYLSVHVRCACWSDDASGSDAEQSGGSSGGVLHGVVYSDDDSDLGIGEFHELIASECWLC